jgi:hypothetical protein
MERVRADEVYYHHKHGLWLRDGAPFSGITESKWDEVNVRAEFRDGVKLRSRGWLASGTLVFDYHYLGELLHGPRREWHGNGQLAEDGECEYGIVIWSERRDERGTLVEAYRLEESHSDYQKLQLRRSRYGAGRRVPTRSDDKEPVRWVAVPGVADYSLPVPTHLAGWLEPHRLIDIEIEGTLRCPCGGEGFGLHYTTQEDCREDGLEPSAPPRDYGDSYFRPRPRKVEVGGASFFRVVAVCADCRRECVLYDEDFHGRGFRYHKPAQAARPRPPLWAWCCRECGFATHAVEVQINLTPRENYFETNWVERDGPERWPDAFDWFRLGIRCCRCWWRDREWMGVEGK